MFFCPQRSGDASWQTKDSIREEEPSPAFPFLAHALLQHTGGPGTPMNQIILKRMEVVAMTILLTSAQSSTFLPKANKYCFGRSGVSHILFVENCRQTLAEMYFLCLEVRLRCQMPQETSLGLHPLTHRPRPHHACVLKVRPLPGKHPPLPHLPTSTVLASPQRHCPSLGRPRLLSPAAGRADCCPLALPQLCPDALLKHFPNQSSNSICWASQWDCRFSGGTAVLGVGGHLEQQGHKIGNRKPGCFLPEDLRQVHPCEPWSTHLQNGSNDFKVLELLD